MNEPTVHSINIAPSAQKALTRIKIFVASGGAPVAAERLVERILVAIEGLRHFPSRGRPVGRYRELTTVRPYVIRYIILADVVLVVRIRHGAQRPD